MGVEAEAVVPARAVLVEEPDEDGRVERGEDDVRVVRIEDHGEEVHGSEEDLGAENALEKDGDRRYLLLPVLVEIADVRHYLEWHARSDRDGWRFVEMITYGMASAIDCRPYDDLGGVPDVGTRRGSGEGARKY